MHHHSSSENFDEKRRVFNGVRDAIENVECQKNYHQHYQHHIARISPRPQELSPRPRTEHINQALMKKPAATDFLNERFHATSRVDDYFLSLSHLYKKVKLYLINIKTAHNRAVFISKYFFFCSVLLRFTSEDFYLSSL
ncbi:MAG: hypothetical protein AAB355_01630 [Patescibacteria group bacterium]